jgi:uncharacterized MAPEG superfamily protein
MSWIVLIALLALLQQLWFGILVSRARGRYGVTAPAVTGNTIFERYYRVQMNTLELLVLFVPALYLSALYVPPLWPALLGVLYLIGRLLYARAYITDPPKRGLGFGLSLLPIMALLLLGLIGTVLRLARG